MIATGGTQRYYFDSGMQPSESLTEDDLEEFFEFNGMSCDITLSSLQQDAMALVTRIMGLATLMKDKVVVARVVHGRENDEAKFFSYAVLNPYGMNLVWEVFPVLSHSRVSMPEATIMPWLNHMKEQGRLDFRETRFWSEDQFENWVKRRQREFQRWDSWWLDHEGHAVAFAEDPDGGKGLFCHDCRDWR